MCYSNCPYENFNGECRINPSKRLTSQGSHCGILEAIADGDILEDSKGNLFSIECPVCGETTIYINKDDKAVCGNEGCNGLGNRENRNGK